MTSEQADRVVESIAQTKNQLQRELRYDPKFRDMPAIQFYSGHLAKLQVMLHEHNASIVDPWYA